MVAHTGFLTWARRLARRGARGAGSDAEGLEQDEYAGDALEAVRQDELPEQAVDGEGEEGEEGEAGPREDERDR
jgi:hypothetical protein